MERAVELVCFYHYIVTLIRKNVVCAVVLGYSSKEGVAVDVALVHDVCTHCGGACLAVCAGYAESVVCECERAEYLGSLLYFESSVAEELQFLVFGGYRRCVDYEAGFRVAACMRNLVDVLFIVDEHSFALKLVCQG